MKSGFLNDEHSLPCKQDLECEYEMPKGTHRSFHLILFSLIIIELRFISILSSTVKYCAFECLKLVFGVLQFDMI